MNKTAKFCIILLLGLTAWSCKPKDPEFTRTMNSEPLSIADLLAGIESYKDKEVTLKVFLVKHVDGPWLADDINEPLKDLHYISVTGVGDCKFFGPDGSQIDYWDAPDSVLARGHFRVGDYKNPSWGIIHENHPHFELKAIIAAEQAASSNH